MPISVFEELNKEAKTIWWKIFSNPRNAASWSVRLLDNSVTKKRKLKFFAYDLANFEEFTTKENIVNYYDVIIHLKELWFEISSYFKKLNWINEVINSIENFWEIKKEIDFEIDWLVIKVNEINLWKKVWSTEHHPRYAIAYKFPAEIVTTKIIWVEHSIWRTGTITPIAHLEPINISWVIVRRATLHNYEEIENLDVRIWDTIFIKRAWEVIPKIISVVKEGRIKDSVLILPPELCPSCFSLVIKDNNKVRYYCTNKFTCAAQNIEKLAWSIWKQWFNIDWLWEKQIEIFLNNWIITDLSSIFKIEIKIEEILELEWFQEKSINNLIESINNAKNIDISRFLTALWINWVGKKTAKTLSQLFENKEKLLEFNYSIEDLEKLEDIWPEIAKNVIDFFNNNKILIDKLIKILNIKFYKKRDNNNWYFAWKNVCITWSFDWFSRDELIIKLENNWWEFISSISKKTDYLLAWEKAWSKLKKAQELWIDILDLTDFIKIV
jgi:DNA ligase (NAD+)